MENKVFTIVVFFKAKPRKEQALKDFLTSIIEIAFQSSGCITHDLHQSINDPSQFMFYENWINEAAHDQHVARPEVQTWREKLNDFLAESYQASEWKKL